MQSTLQVLERHGVSDVHAILGIGHALFRAIDVAKGLGLKNPTMSIGYYFPNLPKHGKCRYMTTRQVYELLLRSKKITAHEFRTQTCVDLLVRSNGAGTNAWQGKPAWPCAPLSTDRGS
jgi:prophage antirepressor-like protein